jgi:hypothetical protein
MADAWEAEFNERMRAFEAQRPIPGGQAVSIKIRVTAGCFHREHSPHAYALIDSYLRSMPDDGRESQIVEHESGPEVLHLITAGLELAGAVVGLITVIFAARHKGIEQGDGPSEPLELIVRRMDENGTVREETLLRVSHTETVDERRIESLLNRALERQSGQANDGR